MTNGSPSRSERESRIAHARRARLGRRTLWIVIVFIVLAGGIGGLVWMSRRQSANAPGVSYPEVGREHTPLKSAPPVAYNSNPPSSGAHFGSPANWGVYTYEVDDQIFIHNLEHGGIWIAYRPQIGAAVIGQLQAIADEFKGSKIVMAPRSANDSDIAVAAWTRVLKFDLAGGTLTSAQLDQIRGFYRAFKNRGPEFVPDTMPGIDPKSVQ